MQKLTLSIVVLAVIGGAAALWFAAAPVDQPLSGFGPTRAVALFPTLQDRRQDVAAIEIETARQQLRLERADDGWRSVTHQGYPVRDAAIESLLEHLAALRADYVSDAAPRSASGPQGVGDRVVVRLFGPDRGLVAASVIGHEITVPGEPGGARLMMRREQEQREWLASPVFRVTMDDGTWLRRDLLDLPRDRVARLTSISEDGERVVIERSGQQGLRVVQGGTDSDLAGHPRLESAAAVLENLEFDEARRVDRIAGDTADGRTIIDAADGLRYTIEWRSGGGRSWATFSATAGDAQSGELPDQAQRFNRRHAAWAYRLPLLVQNQLRIRPSELRDLQQNAQTLDEQG
jgi:hypothetical protein